MDGGISTPAGPVRRLGRSAIVRVLLVAAAAALAVRVGCSLVRRPDAPDVLLERAVVTVARGVHLLGLTYPNASYLVETSEGLVLVDTCPEADAAPILAQMDTLGHDVRRLRRILLTHAHADHVLGARRLVELSGATVAAGRRDADVIRGGDSRDALFTIFEMPQPTHPTPVDLELDGGEVVELGDTRLLAVAAPGHTPGSMCYLLERDGLRLLFTGDVVMSLGGGGPLTGPGHYSAYLPPRYRGDARDSLETLRKLRAMQAPDLVLPGHPAADRSAQDARMTKERWETLLSAGVARLETLVARHEEDGPDFLDGVPKQVLPGVHYWGELGGISVYGLVTPLRRLYLVNAPGAPGQLGLLADRQRATGLGDVQPTAVLLTTCEPDATAGLRELVETTGCAVVAPEEGLDAVRAACPDGTEVIAAETLVSRSWFPVVVAPVHGLAAPGAAYAVRWGDSTVVLSGRQPAKIILGDGVLVVPRDPWPGLDRERYVVSLEALEALRPDVWLPAAPVKGQNANLYDDEWEQVLHTSRRQLR